MNEDTWKIRQAVDKLKKVVGDKSVKKRFYERAKKVFTAMKLRGACMPGISIYDNVYNLYASTEDGASISVDIDKSGVCVAAEFEFGKSPVDVLAVASLFSKRDGDENGEESWHT